MGILGFDQDCVKNENSRALGMVASILGVSFSASMMFQEGF